MIKGHSGSGSRSALQEGYLRLSESESPHLELSKESDRPYPLSYPPAAPVSGQYQMDIHSPDFMYPHDGSSPYHHQDSVLFNWYGIDLSSSTCVSPSNSTMMKQNSQYLEPDNPMSSDTLPKELEGEVDAYIRPLM